MRGNLSRVVLSAALVCFSAAAYAQTLTGTVKNATTGKPAAGDDVVLLSLGQGMEESGRTKTDAKGSFSLKLDSGDSPHLVRVIHDGVTYHRMAPPGTTSVEVEVYDAGKKVEGIAVVADIMRVQVEQGQLEIMRAFAVQNTSKPPRTQMNEHNLEFNVPEGAEIIQGEAMTEGGQPLNTSPVPEDDKKTRYAFVFPLRPGTTQFQVAYQLPYTGSANIDPKSIYPLQHFVAIMPKTIDFSAAPGTNFKPMNDPQQPDANVQVASGAGVGQTLAFKISGEGTLQSRDENGGAPGAPAPAQGESRPGGGLGPPIDAPPPLQKYQLWILGGFAVALVGGGVIVASRQQAAHRAAARARAKDGTVAEFGDNEYEEVEVLASGAAGLSDLRPDESRLKPVASTSSASPSSMLLQGLKDELFELEVEHKQGRISQEEYESARAALDQTLQRALKRASQKA